MLKVGFVFGFSKDKKVFDLSRRMGSRNECAFFNFDNESNIPHTNSLGLMLGVIAPFLDEDVLQAKSIT